MKAKFCLAAGAAIALVMGAASPAAAQIAPGRSGRSTQTYLSGQEVWRELAAFGKCYARRNTEEALRLVATRPSSREEIETYKDLFRRQNQGCLGSITELRAPPGLIRGAIAEGLYAEGIPLPPAMAEPAPAPGEIRNLSDAARCYVEAHGAEARELIAATSPGTEEEKAAVLQLLPHFVKCVPDGVRPKFSAMQIRFRIAEALWRAGGVPVATAGSD